jgi:uncharacterized protein DUF1569
MKTVFDKTTRDQLILRINNLDENRSAEWGKMNLYQMLKHCSLWEEMAFGRKKYKRVFMGVIFGKIALKSLLKDEKPMSRNAPTISQLKVKGNGNVTTEKKNWIAHMEAYANFSNHKFVHPFFGKMTKEQIGYLAYKHADHHLRQFKA